MENFKKIENGQISEDGECSFEFRTDLYCNTVNKYLEERIGELVYDLFMATEKCESPIEQIFAMELLKITDEFMRYIDNKKYYFNCNVYNQEEIKIGDDKYRVDFLIEYFIYNSTDDIESGIISIECDGFDFHHKTKEQVIHDLKKDRALQKCGIDILHFLGSEIVKDVSSCVCEIQNFIISKIKPNKVEFPTKE